MSTAASSAADQVKLISRTQIAEGTMSFRFEKPSGWMFKAGQSMDMTLLEPSETDAEGNTRAFSIASAPHDESLMVATRMRDTAFKRVLGTMPLGTAVKIEGPFGNLILDDNAARTAVLLAGGIGITPFRSMVLRAAKEKLPRPMFLFFSNRRPEDAPFLEELQTAERDNPHYKFVPTMTEMAKTHRPWGGETGLISKGMLSKYLKNASSPVYYIAGPPGMVKGLHETLTQAGVDDDDVRTEEFAGY
jgi:ferredoxin-NADP reductase